VFLLPGSGVLFHFEVPGCQDVSASGTPNPKSRIAGGLRFVGTPVVSPKVTL